MDEACEVDGTPVIACCEAPEMLHAAIASFDLIAVFVDSFVVGNEDRPVPLGGDDRLGLHISDLFAQVIAVIGFVGKYRLGSPSFQKVGSSGDVVRLGQP